MSYTPGVTDRTHADILAKNSKAYFNSADWSRIYDNALYLNGLFVAMFGIPIGFTVIAVPTNATTGTAANLNALLTNIKNLWHIPNLTISGIVDVKTDWLGGIASASPTYIDVNNWELDLGVLNAFIGLQEKDRWPRCGIALTGSGMTRQNGWR